MTKRFGFTLAEVLITLAIIGVVAAMTMPTLINNTNSAQFKTAYKKAMSVLSQAVVMNIALDDYDFEGTAADNAANADATSLYAIFANRTNGSLLSDNEANNYTVYIKADGTDPSAETGNSPTSNYVFRFQDGIIFSFPKDDYACTESDPCYGWVDTNGTKGPNRSAYCTQNTDNECTSSAIINDIFPIKFYDQSVAPASAAARAVLYGYESNGNGINGK